MGRPKKTDIGPVPTRDRILRKATELFARDGYDAVSVRKITGSLGLNEASLYNHFENKEDLLMAIFRRLDERFINPGFMVPPPELFEKEAQFDLTEYLVAGARIFFSRADSEILHTWRILMISQYRHEIAKNSLQAYLLDAPCNYFAGMLESLKRAGKVRKDADCTSVGRIIAAVFFDWSFRSILDTTWNDERNEDLSQLRIDLRFIVRGLTDGGGG